MNQHIYDTLCADLFDPARTGVEILPQFLPPALLPGVLNELEQNQRNFVRRPLFYGTTIQMLSSWDFERAVLQNYDYLRAVDDRYAELSQELHARMSHCAPSHEVQVNASQYGAGTLGIGAHRDNTFSVNFVVIFVLSGTNSFITASDKDGGNEIEYPVVPGDCIVMRGPRANVQEERALRPIHYVQRINTERFILTFREINHDYLHHTGRHHQYNA